MKKAWNDYKETILKPTTKWLSEYWKKYLVLLIICYVVGYVIGLAIWFGDLTDRIKKLFMKLRRR